MTTKNADLEALARDLSLRLWEVSGLNPDTDLAPNFPKVILHHLDEGVNFTDYVQSFYEHFINSDRTPRAELEGIIEQWKSEIGEEKNLIAFMEHWVFHHRPKQNEIKDKLQTLASLEINAGFVHTSEALALQLWEARSDSSAERDAQHGVTLGNYTAWVHEVNTK